MNEAGQEKQLSKNVVSMGDTLQPGPMWKQLSTDWNRVFYPPLGGCLDWAGSKGRVSFDLLAAGR